MPKEWLAAIHIDAQPMKTGSRRINTEQKRVAQDLRGAKQRQPKDDDVKPS